MGTSWKVIASAPKADATALQGEISERLEDLEKRVSHYRDDSEITRFNDAKADLVIQVSDETAMLVSFAEEMRRISGGAFDIRIARRVASRGFGPPSLAVNHSGELSPGGTITMGSDPPTLSKSDSALTIDLSAFAKGYAVDRVAALLDGRGIEDYLVEIGGELKAKGFKAEKTAWSVGVEAPNPLGSTLHLALRLNNEAVASSGNYRLFREQDNGDLQSHLVDPRSHDDPPDRGFRSVSVILPDAMSADAWATTLFVMGDAEGAQLARENQIPVCFLRLDRKGKVVERCVAGFEQSISR